MNLRDSVVITRIDSNSILDQPFEATRTFKPMSGDPDRGACRPPTAAALRAAKVQAMTGDDASMSWQDTTGHWHEEMSKGTDRPDTRVDG